MNYFRLFWVPPISPAFFLHATTCDCAAANSGRKQIAAVPHASFQPRAGRGEHGRHGLDVCSAGGGVMAMRELHGCRPRRTVELHGKRRHGRERRAAQRAAGPRPRQTAELHGRRRRELRMAQRAAGRRARSWWPRRTADLGSPWKTMTTQAAGGRACGGRSSTEDGDGARARGRCSPAGGGGGSHARARGRRSPRGSRPCLWPAEAALTAGKARAARARYGGGGAPPAPGVLFLAMKCPSSSTRISSSFRGVGNVALLV